MIEHEFTLILNGRFCGEEFIEEVDLQHEEHGFITGSARNVPIVECFIKASCLSDAFMIAVEHILATCPDMKITNYRS